MPPGAGSMQYVRWGAGVVTGPVSCGDGQGLWTVLPLGKGAGGVESHSSCQDISSHSQRAMVGRQGWAECPGALVCALLRKGDCPSTAEVSAGGWDSWSGASTLLQFIAEFLVVSGVSNLYPPPMEEGSLKCGRVCVFTS